MLDEPFIEIHHLAIGTLREEYKIFGKLIGTVARAPHKSQLKGYPVKLSFEELATLVSEFGAAISLKLVRSVLSNKVGPVTDSILEQHSSVMKINYEEMCANITEERIRKTNEHFNNQKSRKRKADEMVSILPKEESVFVHLPLSTPDNWLRSSEKLTVELPKTTLFSEMLPFLVSVWKDRLGIEVSIEVMVKSAVYHKLWSLGHHVTVACKKMGGDYLLYSGDPWVCHATHVVKLLPTSGELYPCEVISTVRLVSSLKKACLIAWYSPPTTAHIPDLIQSLNISFNKLSWCGKTP